MAYQTFSHQIWWVMACYDLAHQIRCAKHTFRDRCDITPMVCCSFGGHSTPQFLQCGRGIGGVLSQEFKDGERRTAYYSKKLNPAQQLWKKSTSSCESILTTLPHISWARNLHPTHLHRSQSLSQAEADG